MGQVEVPEILRFSNDDFLFNHVWDKTLRDCNVLALREIPNQIFVLFKRHNNIYKRHNG